MMTITQLKKRKQELGYTNEMIAEKSGIPLSTVQKAFSGATKHPRYDTLLALTKVLSEYSYDYTDYVVQEEAAEYSYDYDMQIKSDSAERWPRQGHYTVRDMEKLPDEIRVELIDGVIYDMASPRRVHQDLLAELFMHFYQCTLKSERGCRVYIAPRDVRLFREDRNLFVPDIFIICDEKKNLDEYYDGAPELVTEILSPSTRSRDCTLKLNKYMEAGVKEYWIVDSVNERVMVYYFEEDVVPEIYSFDDVIPVGISKGQCEIDFGMIKERLK